MDWMKKLFGFIQIPNVASCPLGPFSWGKIELCHEVWYLCTLYKYLPSEGKRQNRNSNSHSGQSHTDQLWVKGVLAWEKSCLSIDGDYDSGSCSHSAPTQHSQQRENCSNLCCGKTLENEAVCLHLSVSNDVWPHTTFSLRHGDINSRDTLLNQILCLLLKWGEARGWCFYLVWINIKTILGK